MKKIVQFKLRLLSILILKKYKPKIIGITGSIGKTSTREAVYSVLSDKFNTRQSIKNYNNEIGVPLTIIGSAIHGKSLLSWMLIFLKALKLILIKDSDYPKLLILEMGVDRPGDMTYLTNFIKCDIGIVTMIGPSHAKYFSSIAKIQEEKSILIKKLKGSGFGILNFDNKESAEIKEKVNKKIITYGFNEGADVLAYNLSFNFKNKIDKIDDLSGMSYRVKYKNTNVDINLSKVIGFSAIYASLAGIASGIAFGLSLEEIKNKIDKFNMPKGRMNAIKGIKHTLIIDDTYNSSPQSCISGIDFIGKISIKGNKWAVLGDMLELGAYSEAGHLETGKRVFKNKFDKLVTVGERARDFSNGAKKVGMNKDDIMCFSNSNSAGMFLQEKIKKDDLIFIKGSQGVRMEKIVKEIMAEPLNAKNLLVRQDSEWK